MDARVVGPFLAGGTPAYASATTGRARKGLAGSLATFPGTVAVIHATLLATMEIVRKMHARKRSRFNVLAVTSRKRFLVRPISVSGPPIWPLS